jgi:hypothetical protein
MFAQHAVADVAISQASPSILLRAMSPSPMSSGPNGRVEWRGLPVHRSPSTPCPCSASAASLRGLERTQYMLPFPPYSPGGKLFEAMSKTHTLEGNQYVRSRFPRIGNHKCKSIGMERATGNGAGRLAYQDHLVLPAVS